MPLVQGSQPQTNRRAQRPVRLLSGLLNETVAGNAECRVQLKGCCILLVRLEYSPIVRTNIAVALTSICPYLLQIDDVNAATAVRDHPGLLQISRDLRHAGAPDAHHLRQKFLRKW